MLAVRNTEHGIASIAVDEPTGEGVLVRVASAGICGSDLEMLQFGPSAVTLGHEIAGTVVSTDQAVAIEPVVHCGTCDRCVAGESAQCRGATGTMCGVDRDGGMAEYVMVNAACLVPLARSVELRSAGLVEPIAVNVHGAHRGGVAEGMRVAVVGAGTIGLLAAAVAQAITSSVAITARHAAQQRAAEMLGLERSLGRNYDVVFEASGTEGGLTRAIELCRRGGTVVLVAMYWQPITVSLLTAGLKEISLVTAYTYGHHHGRREFDEAAALLAANPHWADAIITHRFPLSEARAAFAAAADRASGAIKVVFEP